MKRVLITVLAGVALMWTLPACHSGHHGWGKAPPGQVKKATGYNPASGKVKVEPKLPGPKIKPKIKIK